MTTATLDSQERAFIAARDAAPVDSAALLLACAEFFHVTVEELTSRRQIGKTMRVPVQMAMYLCRELCGHSLERIGRRFGGRDHTTVWNAWNNIRRCIEHDSVLRRWAGEIEERAREV